MDILQAFLNRVIDWVSAAWALLPETITQDDRLVYAAVPVVVFFLSRLLRRLPRGRAAKPFDIPPAYVIDGDTLASGDMRIRIWGIDAPETGQRQGDAARRHMIRLIKGRNLRVEPRDLDKYGRVVARVLVEGQDIGETMVADGYAIACTDVTKVYARAMRRARRSGAGLWRHGAIQDPGAWRKSHG